MPKKKQKLSTVKKRVWTWFSKYIRMKYSDDLGYCSCVTCGATKHYSGLQAGHFVPKKAGNAVYFVEENVHPQCYQCNINLGSNGPMYNKFILETYGQEKIDELIELSRTTLKFTVNDLLEMEQEYKQLAKEVAKEKGFEI